MNRARHFVLAAASLTLLAGMATTANMAGAEEVPEPPAPKDWGLENNSADPAPCPTSVVGPAWHFVAPPKSKTDFVSITLNVGGTIYANLPFQSIPLPGDAYVSVPSGWDLDDLRIEGSVFSVIGELSSGGVRLSHTCTGQPPEPTRPVITVSKTAVHTSSADYDWSVVKTVTGYRLNDDGTVDVDYDIDVTKSVLGNKVAAVSGVITVANAAENSVPVTITSVTDDIDGLLDESCGTIDITGKTALGVGQSFDYPYSCTVAYGLSGEDTNEATAGFSWTTDAGVLTGSASGTVGFTYVEPTITDDSTTVTDDYGTPGNLLDDKTFGPTSVSTSYSYTRPAVVAGGTACNPGFVNTATVTDPTLDDNGGNSDDATVQLCTNTGGYTIGFWGNNNGWNLLKPPSTIRSNVAALYPNVGTFDPQGTSVKAPLAWTSQSNARAYFQNANCSGTCQNMFAAQFLATAFNVQRTPSLGTTHVVIPPALADEFDPETCVSVNDLLAAANAYFPTIGWDNVDTTTAYKSLFDRINNNAALTCTI